MCVIALKAVEYDKLKYGEKYNSCQCKLSYG